MKELKRQIGNFKSATQKPQQGGEWRAISAGSGTSSVKGSNFGESEVGYRSGGAESSGFFSRLSNNGRNKAISASRLPLYMKQPSEGGSEMTRHSARTNSIKQ